jgi:hypothetical protein
MGTDISSYKGASAYKVEVSVAAAEADTAAVAAGSLDGSLVPASPILVLELDFELPVELAVGLVAAFKSEAAGGCILC